MIHRLSVIHGCRNSLNRFGKKDDVAGGLRLQGGQDDLSRAFEFASGTLTESEKEWASIWKVPNFREGAVRSAESRSTTSHLGRFFADDDLERLGISRDQFSNVIGTGRGYLLSKLYPEAETVRQMLGRARKTEDMYVGLTPEGSNLFSQVSRDPVLEQRYKDVPFGINLPEDAFIGKYEMDAETGLPSPHIYRPGVLATTDNDFITSPVQTVSVFEGSGAVEWQSSIFVNQAAPSYGGIRHPVTPVEHITKEGIVHPERLLYQGTTEDFSRLLDAPAEILAVDPRRRFLTEQRPFGMTEVDLEQALRLQGGSEDSLFGLSNRLITHRTSPANYENILEGREILSGKLSGQSTGMEHFDKYAGDDELVFLGSYDKGYDHNAYGPSGLIFPLEPLVEKFDARVSAVDLLDDYEYLAEELATEWADDIPDSMIDPFMHSGFREEFRYRAENLQDYQREYGEAALDLFDEEPRTEILVPNRVPISEAVGIFQENRPQLILPASRGADPLKWQLDQFPLRLQGGLNPFDEDVLLPDSGFTRTRQGMGQRFRRWASGKQSDRAWGGFTQQVADVAQNAALIQSAATATVAGIHAFVGHDVELGSFLRAGAEVGGAVGLNLYNRHYGSRMVLPEEAGGLGAVDMSQVPSDAGVHLRNIFKEAGAGTARWNRGSLLNALEGYGGDDLVSMFGESGADYLLEHAGQTQRFGQQSWQTQRNYAETMLGVYTGDFGKSKRYVYDPEVGAVNVQERRGFTLDRVLEGLAPRSNMAAAWKMRRDMLRADPSQDKLARFLGPLQGEDASPHIGYMMLPEARGIGRFFGRYFAEPDVDKQLIKNWGLEDMLRGLPTSSSRITKWADDISSRKKFVGERAEILEGRRLDPTLYEWQDSEHFYQQMSARLGTEALGGGFGTARAGSPYSKYGRFLSRLPKGANAPLAAAGIGLGAKLGYETFLDDSQDDELIISDPNRYSMSVRYPVLGAIQQTLPYRRLRARGSDLLDNVFGEDSFHAEMMKSIVLGEKGNLPRDVTEQFVETGQIHALVQSGMHVGMATGILSRYPALALPAAISAIKDTVVAPDERVIEPEESWLHKYTLSDNPNVPRWNPSKWNAPKDFEAPWWGWWDKEFDSDAKFESQMAYRGQGVVDNGWIYRLTHEPTGRQYVGLSASSAIGRINKHLTGKGSAEIADALRAGATPDEFMREIYPLGETTFAEIGRAERYMIKASGSLVEQGGFNKTRGGEMFIRQDKGAELLRADTLKAQDVVPWAVYGMFGVLPEAMLSHSEQRARTAELGVPEMPSISQPRTYKKLIQDPLKDSTRAEQVDSEREYFEGGEAPTETEMAEYREAGEVQAATEHVRDVSVQRLADEEMDAVVERVLAELAARRRAGYTD